MWSCKARSRLPAFTWLPLVAGVRILSRCPMLCSSLPLYYAMTLYPYSLSIHFYITSLSPPYYAHPLPE